MVEKETTAKKPPATPEAPTKAVAPPPKDPQALTLEGKKGDTIPQAKAKAATRASINAVMVVNAYQSNIMGNDVDITELVTEMQAKFKAVNDGDMENMENMLVGQATALQTMFTHLAQRAVEQENMKHYQTFMVLALKAQAQSRATISALVDLKYPKQAATFVKQANIANGPQQVNNGAKPESGTVRAGTHAHAGQNTGRENELLEQQHGNYLDTRAQGTAGGADTHLEAVGTGQRAAHT